MFKINTKNSYFEELGPNFQRNVFYYIIYLVIHADINQALLMHLPHSSAI